jgi:hypothetical protein
MPTYPNLQTFLDKGAAVLARGPVALILVEDAVEVTATIRHSLMAGFRSALVLHPADLPLGPDEAERENVHAITWNTLADGALSGAVNRVIAACPPTTWLHYCYNAEFLFHPFCETRNVREMIAFHAEERRDAMLTYVVDLYAADLERFPHAVSLNEAMLDRSGYYALARKDPKNNFEAKERQLDFFGGLRWRFEEHIPPARRRIDRISLFRAQKGLVLREDHTFNIEEYNTYACPWHHNITAAVASFRTAKALRTNPGSRYLIPTFRWQNSEGFLWNSQQLMDLGLMEPGQWF